VLEGARLVSWEIVFTRQARKDARKLAAAGLRPSAERLLELLKKNPFQTPPPCERLLGDLAGAFSRRINIRHRLVYQVLREIKTVKVIRMWTHYE
jgi:Txe/YoeB family toxin of toxin-antitoxin system